MEKQKQIKYPLHNESVTKTNLIDYERNNYFKAKRDDGKLRFDLVPVSQLEALASIFNFGAGKYGENTWQKVPNAIERYYAALFRHLIAWRKGEKKDPESGQSHLAHVMWNAGALMELDEKGNKE